ncbi:restriction endonuclease subunit S [Clostridium sporogenes]|uniref:restriction endonuclease subunit S n=1 Tax=Clostridium sporogenes TaxID=1509 RepID=UPI0022384B94|nr:restriction endonuclease subunit S [Clostridium sporogenes]MCW6078094.1 restriction endonuclease subunit S [Clostridium sporogenes]
MLNYLNNTSRFNWVNEKLLSDRIDAKNYKKEYIEIKKMIMKQNYTMVKDIIDDINNGYELSRNYSDTGINYITISDLNEFEIDYSSIKKVDLKLSDVPQKGKLSIGDIIISRSGSIGIAKNITNNDVKSIISYDIMKLKVSDKIDHYYLTTYLNSDIAQKLIEQLSYGAVMKKIGQEEFLKLLVPIPSPEIQKYIGDKVRKAEELREEAKKFKNEADNILNNELEIKNLKEKLNIHTEKYSWTKSQHLSDRIDGEFYKTEFVLNNEHLKRLNLQGIKIKKLKDIILNGSYGILPSSSDYGKGEVELLRSTNVKEFLIEDSDVIKVPVDYYKDKVRICNGDILLEIKGQCYAGAVVENVKNKTIVNGSIFKFSVKEEFNNYYILGYLLSQSGQLQKKQNLANSIISYLSIDCINKLGIPILGKEKQNIIGEKYRMYVQNCLKSKELIKEAKQDIEDLIEGNFYMSKIKETN